MVEVVDVAHAASGRAGGFLALDWCDGQDTEQLTRRSFLLHQTLAEELGQDIGYRKLTTLSLAVDSKRPGRGEARRGPGWVSGHVTERRVLGTSSTTAQVHPRLLTRALMERAARAGARVVRDEMTGLRVRSGAVTGLELSSGVSLPAEVVVLCMGPWTGRGDNLVLAQKYLPHFSLKRPPKICPLGRK